MIVNSINLDSTLHPLLYRLTIEVMNIYKIEKHRDFFGGPPTSFFWKSDLIARAELNIITWHTWEPKSHINKFLLQNCKSLEVTQKERLYQR